MNVPERVWQLLQSDVAGPTHWYEVILYAVLFLTLSWAASRLVKRLAKRILAGDRDALLDRTSFLFLTQLASVGIYLFFGILYLHFIPGFRGAGTALLAGVSVLSVVVGLAAQGALSNFVAGVSLLLYRPLKIGDTLQIAVPGGTEQGVVESLNLGHTTLRTTDGRRIIVPNSQMNMQTFLRLPPQPSNTPEGSNTAS